MYSGWGSERGQHPGWCPVCCGSSEAWGPSQQNSSPQGRHQQWESAQSGPYNLVAHMIEHSNTVLTTCAYGQLSMQTRKMEQVDLDVRESYVARSWLCRTSSGGSTDLSVRISSARLWPSGLQTDVVASSAPQLIMLKLASADARRD